MKTSRPSRSLSLAALAVLANALCAPLALAQAPDGPPPGPPPGPGGAGRSGRQGRPRQITAANVPAAILATELSLTDEQKSKITQIQQQTQEQRRKLLPPPGGPNGNGGPPDPQTMQATMQKIRSLDQKASKDIESTLTDSQKESLPTLLKAIQAMGAAGVSPRSFSDLKLTADQKKQLADIAQEMQKPPQASNSAPDPGTFREMHQKMQAKVMAVLTEDQKTQVNKLRQQRPQPGPGGPGDFNGPGGPPPGPGGPDGPPPPPGDNA